MEESGMQRMESIERVIDLIDPTANVLFNMPLPDAIDCVGSGDPSRIRSIDGHFALIHVRDKTIRLARSIGRPMRYFIVKRADGPCLIVAERIDAIRDWLRAKSLET